MSCRISSCWVSILVLLISGGTDYTTVSDYELAHAEKILQEAKIATDGASLLQFFRDRSRGEGRPNRLATLVRQLGDDSFDVREKASRELMAVGKEALPFLRDAVRSPDLEVA